MKTKLALIFSVLLLFVNSKNASAAVSPLGKIIVRPNVVISATIGIPKMTLWGYGAPDSAVEVSGVGVDQRTTSGPDGLYSFDLIYLRDGATFPELCVTEFDRGSRATPPTCIPPIGTGNYFYDVGPVILPPTISIGAPETHIGSQVSAQGETIPNSSIEIKLARPDDKRGILGFEIIERVLAYYVPSYSVLSDTKGGYSFNMPTNTGSSWRVFAIADYQDIGKSPKSNTLKFEALTPGAFAWKNLLAFLATFLVWPRIIILEFLIIVILVFVVLIVRHNKKYQKTLKAN